MLSVSTQERLADFILSIAKGEDSLEIVRQSLSKQVLFCPYTAFLRLTNREHLYITKEDIANFLK